MNFFDSHLTAQLVAAPAKVLVVDDEPRLRESVAALLRSRDYQVAMCDGGQSALSHLMQGGVDLMLLDLNMGEGMSGLDLLAMVHRAGIDTSIIVVSGDVMIDSAIGALRLGAADYVRKPYVSEELLHRVEMVLQRRQLKHLNQKMARQLQHSERMHRSLLDASPDLIFTLDTKHCFTFINDRAHELIGYRPEELSGKSLLSILAPAEVERIRYALEKITGQRTIEMRISHQEKEIEPRHFEVSFVSVELDFLRPGDGSALTSRLYGIARDVSDKKATQDRLAYLAYHDALTGLPNRILLRDRLGLAMMQARRSGSRVATMFIDLDRFKFANDTFGHLQGDELLKQAAQRLRSVIRDTDTLARVGGDEFTILLSDIPGKEEAALIAAKLVAVVADPFTISGCEVFLTASVGIAVYPDDGEDTETLLRHADIAMYHVKAQGKNDFGFFQPFMDETSSRRLGLESELRRALELQQFELYFQPQVEARHGQIVGCEALIRWQHPLKGLLAAGAFLDVMEEIGLMPALTDWVIEQACQSLRAWWQDGKMLSRISVNVPPSVLMESDFCERLTMMLDRYEIVRQCFELEITENAFITDPQLIAQRLTRLVEAGVRVAIDDFGTQYSSLSYLRYLPVTTLKIDQSFVREIEAGQLDSPIVRAIVAIAAGLNLHLVAEGVETDLQAEYLAGLGVHEMQGYLFGRPMRRQALGDLL